MNSGVFRFRIAVLVFTTLAVLTVPLMSQDQWKVEGRVFDNDTREPIPGVNVIVRGSKIGTATDTTGYFSLRFQSAEPRILVFSHIAYRKDAWRLAFDSTKAVGVRIYLTQDTIRYDEVVVTAKRQIVPSKASEKRATIIIGGEDFERLGEPDIVRALYYFLPLEGGAPAGRPGKIKSGFALYVNGEWQESETLSTIDPFNIRRVMVWDYWGIAGDVDMFPLGFPPHRGDTRVIAIETYHK